MIIVSGGASLIILTCLGGVGLIAASSMIIAQSVLIGIESLNSFITTILSMRWSKRKKKEFRERIKLIEEYKNKLFYYTQKVREDGIITIDELERFDLLLNEFNNKLLELKFKQTCTSSSRNFTSIQSKEYSRFIENRALNTQTEIMHNQLNH